MIYNQTSLKYVAEKIPSEHYKNLLSYTKERRLDESWTMNQRLAGALQQQSSLPEWKFKCPGFEEYVISLSNQLWEDTYKTCPWDFAQIFNTSDFIRLRNLWVNYQQQGEYNPLHTHSGIISFVVFIDIPYGDEERILHKSNGAFQLEEDVLPVDKTWNGVILLFPASTKHAVYPYYTTNMERITVAGNVFWNVEGPDEEHY